MRLRKISIFYLVAFFALLPSIGNIWSGENSLDLYDSHARFYDSMIGRTTSQDPLAEKYSGVSPYLWCAGNPIRNIDEGGDSIAVLYLHGLVGHLALLIQKDDGKWAYYSMNGNNVYKLTSGVFGGKNYHDLGTKTFDSPMAFLNSFYNQEGKNKRDIQDDKVNNYGYEEAYVIPTTRNQDKNIRERFLQETSQSYNLVKRQCAQVVQRAQKQEVLKQQIWNICILMILPIQKQSHICPEPHLELLLITILKE